MAADPTYPLFPIFFILSAVLLLLVLTTRFVRQSWNLGVSFLCFWLFWEVLTGGINAILWSDNADVKFYVYCDIVSHLQLFTSVVKPACTLLTTRRLYKIVSLRSVLPPSRKEKITDIAVEWIIGCGIPVLATSSDYIVQGSRFSVLEGLGCTNSLSPSWLMLITISSWHIILPSVSVFFYWPKTVYILYRHSRDTTQFLRSNNSISRPSYLRLLALASIDVIISLPVGIISFLEGLVIAVSNDYSIPFYQGWKWTHSDWAPDSLSYAALQAQGHWTLSNYYLDRWLSIVLALVIFSFFGLTADARATYRHGLYTIGKL
ncbi:GPCR fungal pheromone mating factor, partial [Vararia minispora EC-137]